MADTCWFRVRLMMMAMAWMASIAGPLSQRVGAQQDPMAWHLTDEACGNEWATVLATDSLDIVGRCEGSATRVLIFAVTSKAEGDAGRLIAFSLGFCGEIVGADGPPGWGASILNAVSSFGEPARVEWRPRMAASDGAVAVDRLGGFVVRLRPGWRRAIDSGADWENFVEASLSPHDCGEQRRKPGR